MKAIVRNRLCWALAFGLGAAGFSLGASAPAQAARPLVIAAPPSGAPAPVQAHALTRDDVEAFVDGFMPYAGKRGDVAGTVVVVVKDGQILFSKGYGYADVAKRTPVDPARTLFRPGSVSKLFTWTAVMQQVEAGKIDLDADINTYIDFKIPPAFGKPVTMRDLMTHTPGFEETIKNLFTDDPKKNRTLGAALKAWVPTRIFPPGEVSAYSNYGAALAGYAVQRVSGEPFAEYVQNHIFTPLKMKQATFEQPLPKALAADMSAGYKLGSGKPQTFEVIPMSPAGALSASGEAMARFMMAYLNGGELDGARIVSAKSVALMWSNQHQIAPGLPPMGLGFYHMDENGHVVVGHGGDTLYFHSELFLVPGAHTGVFYSQNSAGREGGMLRGPLQSAFMARYFPGPAPRVLPAVTTAKADGKRIAGNYLASRRSESNFLTVAALFGQMEVSADKDGIVHVDGLKGLNDKPIAWHEVAPLRWQSEDGQHVLLAKEKDGKITEIATDRIPAIETFTRVPAWRDAAWNVPALIAMLVVLTLTVLFWPVKAVLRWNYGVSFPYSGREAMLYRLTRLAALADFCFFAGWFAFLVLGGQDLSYFSDAGDPVILGLYGLGMLGILGTIPATIAFIEGLGSAVQSWWSKFANLLIMLACLAQIWFAFSEKLLGVTLHY